MNAIESQRAAHTDAIRMRVAEARVRLAHQARLNNSTRSRSGYRDTPLRAELEKHNLSQGILSQELSDILDNPQEGTRPAPADAESSAAPADAQSSAAPAVTPSPGAEHYDIAEGTTPNNTTPPIALSEALIDNAAQPSTPILDVYGGD